MKKETISEAIGNLDDRYISEALDYKVPKVPVWFKWIAAAACVGVIVTGIFFGKEPSDPFALTAYALDSDHSVQAVIMQEGKSVPVSVFEANNGLEVLVFSSDSPDPNSIPSMMIWTYGDEDETIDAIQDFETQPGKNYICCIISENDPTPYSFPYSIRDEKQRKIAIYTIVIEKTQQGYIARLDDISINDLVYGPDKHFD